VALLTIIMTCGDDATRYLKSMFVKWLATVLSACLLLAGCGFQQQKSVSDGLAVGPLSPSELAVIAYYMGDGSDLHRYDFNKLTHIIYSFVYLDGDRLAFSSPESLAAYQRVVALKEQYPHLKVMLALGGWGGCETCSEVFNRQQNRRAFAESTLAVLQQYGGDGLDLDWEYPSIEGPPGHPFGPEDKDNFTALVRELRHTLGESYILSFAAGGFTEFLEGSVDWQAIMPMLNNVNLMSYDLVNGFSTVTGHHTPLFSTPVQKESTDHAVQYLLRQGVPAEKIVIGAAFYSRVWEGVDAERDGLYQQGTHVPGLPFSEIPQQYAQEQGFRYLWDDTAQAPYAYHPEKQRFATFDDERSVARKTRYAKHHDLGGIMFWQLPGDHNDKSLLEAIHMEKQSAAR
jgi:chitinase